MKSIKKDLSANWNKWCNPDTYNLMPYGEEFITDFYEDLMYEIWANSTEYECMARYESFILTYYNENGIEYDAEVS